MYCFTYVNNFACVVNELHLWSDISSEHPIFIKTVAELTAKNLPEEVINKLMAVNKMFSDLKKEAEDVRMQLHFNSHNPYMFLSRIKELVKKFLIYDRRAIQVYGEVKQFGKEDKVWQTLLEHILEEQEFMYKMFTDINNQLDQYANV